MTVNRKRFMTDSHVSSLPLPPPPSSTPLFPPSTVLLCTSESIFYSPRVLSLLSSHLKWQIFLVLYFHNSNSMDSGPRSRSVSERNAELACTRKAIVRPNLKDNRVLLRTRWHWFNILRRKLNTLSRITG